MLPLPRRLRGPRFRLDQLLDGPPERDSFALGDDTSSLSFAEAAAAATAAGAELQAAGVAPGEIVAVLGRNSVDVAIAYLATWKLGAVVAALNYRLPDSELRRQLSLVRPASIVTGVGFDSPFDQETIRFRPVSGRRLSVESGRRPMTARRFRIAGGLDDPAAVVFTSGTTSEPKGIVISHRGVARNTLALAHAFDFRRDDRFLMSTPLCHVGGIIRLANALWAGAGVVLAPHWAADSFAEQVQRWSATHTMLVGAMLSDLRDLPDRDLDTLSSLRFIYYGAGRTAPTLVRDLAERLPHVDWAQGYGQTELTGGVTLLSPSDHRMAYAGRTDLLSSVGRVLPGSVIVVFSQDNRPCPNGVDGEIAVGGEGLMLGRLTDEGIAPPPLQQGLLRTGDIGAFDDEGYLSIHDRTSEIVKSGGLSIATGQIELRLLEHPGLRETAVFGIPDERLGEALVALVVPRPGVLVQEEELKIWIRARFAGFEVPTGIRAVSTLPRTPAGKVDRNQLRSTYLERIT